MDWKAALSVVMSASEVVGAAQIQHSGLRVPCMMSASGAEIGSPDGYGASWQSVRPSDGGAAPGGSGDEGH
jgi:hypothetical protein